MRLRELVQSRFTAYSIVLAIVFAALLTPSLVMPNTATAAPPTGTIVYDSTINPLPGNQVSEGPEAYAFAEFGNKIAPIASNQPLDSVTLTLSSWACQSGGWSTDDCVSAPGTTFPVPITFNIYAAGANNAVGPLLATVTQTFAVPYRPTRDNTHCTGSNLGKWYDAGAFTCRNGKTDNVTLDFSAKNLVLPATLIYGVEYNTTHYGPNPIGVTSCNASSGGCPYDSLNIAFSEDPTNVSVGSDPNPGTVFQNATYGSSYCDNGLAGTGTFRLDSATSACWGVGHYNDPILNPLSVAPYYVPAVQFKTASPPSPPSPPGSISGYWTVAADGGIFSFGSAQFYGSMGGKPLNEPIVGMAPTGDGAGYWMDASDGGIFAFGDAQFYGSMGGKPLNQPVVGMAPTPDGRGYWLVASDGGMFAFGDARYYGSMGGKPLNSAIVGMTATADGAGYWMVASDGGTFAFGDAQFFGSMGGMPLNKPIVGIAPTGDGAGYWMVASDGGIFAFGDAQFFGSMGGRPINKPMVGMSSTPDGGGYWTDASDGGIFTFGDATFYGSMGGLSLNAPMVGMATVRS